MRLYFFYYTNNAISNLALSLRHALEFYGIRRASKCLSENSCFLFFSSSKEAGIRKARVGFARNALVGLAGSSWKECHVAIGRGRINPTIKLRLPRGKARQITWMSTVPGNHDQVVPLHISSGIGGKSSLFSLTLLPYDLL